MANYYSIKIPKPCHEGWDTMSPKDKGRFCGSCNKTVVDFTKMDTFEIQDFLIHNKDQRICGHIKQTQLDSINIKIPLKLIQQNHNVYKSFFLALLIAMGTSLFSCSSKNGKPQKIDSIEVIDTNKNEVIDVLGIMATHQKKTDSITKMKACKTPKILPSTLEVDGMMMIETVTTGDIVNIPEPIKEATLEIEEPFDIIVGEMLMGEIETPVLSFINIEKPPEFLNTPSYLSITEKRDYFSKQITQFVQDNFNIDTAVNIGLEGKQKIYAQFTITKTGTIADLEIKAPHPIFERETRRVIEKLPKFIPAEEPNNKTVAVKYALPIVYNIE